MQKGETISHEGVVMRTTGDGTAEVEIMAGSACSGCHAKSVCSVGDTQVKIINVNNASDLKPGERVTVMMELSQGFRAVAIGYLLPLAALITAFIASSVAGAGELLCALISFTAVAICYLLIWLSRKRIEKKFEFKIKV